MRPETAIYTSVKSYMAKSLQNFLLSSKNCHIEKNIFLFVYFLPKSTIVNPYMENFFGLLKTEMFYKHEFTSTEHLISEIESYIDYYNNKRIKCKLKGLSPVQYRIQSSRVA